MLGKILKKYKIEEYYIYILTGSIVISIIDFLLKARCAKPSGFDTYVCYYFLDFGQVFYSGQRDYNFQIGYLDSILLIYLLIFLRYKFSKTQVVYSWTKWQIILSPLWTLIVLFSVLEFRRFLWG